ncbi:phosphoenolpyruvate phosphomutase-domain-containing protein [Lophiotrema nucula]|uniref:Phosphoenolpyruvate phosphomutase-domain-containing protein n=1 Tax=Lophiotrema nucula TaxID=690887 RepID=A0A6A5ZIF0_9PLEO|nr:phosphoenolpyruvate phosphomutase-domain-containing protein [Lophiotrema nucula]
MADFNALAKTLKKLHVPGKPLILANVYDILFAQAAASLSTCKAIATASYAVARANGTEDDAMTMETNLDAVSGIGKVAVAAKKPLTVDIQDGYSTKLEGAIKGLIERGAVGCNLEDCNKDTQQMYPLETTTQQIKQTLKVANSLSVSDFVVNASCDTLIPGGSLSEVITRGKLYLAAGATTVFVWGSSQRGLHNEEVKQLIQAFDGRLSVALRMSGKDTLTVRELIEIGLVRVSVGPQIQFQAIDAFKKEAEKLLAQEAYTTS